MIRRKKFKESLDKQINKINNNMVENHILELSELCGGTRKLLFKNFLSGIVKGFGISIGFSLFSAVIIYILQKIIRLNIPVISEYITDIVDIVEKNR